MAVKMGGETTIIQYNDRVLSQYPKKYTERITAKLKAEGARFCFNESVTRIDKAGEAFRVTLKSGAVIECDYVLEATGRRANCDNLGLEDAGVDFSEKGIKVVLNPHLFTQKEIESAQVYATCGVRKKYSSFGSLDNYRDAFGYNEKGSKFD